ncbi:MAG: biopolymer transporter Tol, partial [bacterium]
MGIISHPTDPFYHLYAGGLTGLKGYSYFSLGGNRRWTGELYLRFPIYRNIDHAISTFYLDQIYGAIFAEIGDAWQGNLSHFKRKRDSGLEMRLRMFSWYGIPTAISFIGAYGWDKIQVAELNWRATYGKEWRYYLTILFDFFTPMYKKSNSGIR